MLDFIQSKIENTNYRKNPLGALCRSFRSRYVVAVAPKLFSQTSSYMLLFCAFTGEYDVPVLHCDQLVLFYDDELCSSTFVMVHQDSADNREMLHHCKFHNQSHMESVCNEIHWNLRNLLEIQRAYQCWSAYDIRLLAIQKVLHIPASPFLFIFNIFILFLAPNS